ncbi:MAG: PaaI family thioesterase [Ignavibacteria bacterium]|nr:PaaI family thioesterase [Ignavibacteria bacterium]
MEDEPLAVLEREIQDLQTKAAAGHTFPPNCFVSMKAEFVRYVSRTSLTVSFPVLEESLNPLRKMQGGILSAAFDNTFGPLSYLAARCPCATLDLHTQFIRPVDAGDTITVTARVLSQGPDTLFLSAEAVNRRKKLVATCCANMIILRQYFHKPSKDAPSEQG